MWWTVFSVLWAVLVLFSGRIFHYLETSPGREVTAVTYTDGARYIGGIRNSSREGFGALTLSDGVNYVGWWEKDLLQGYGYILGPTMRYVGALKDGQLHGPGRLTYTEDTFGPTEYYGDWSEAEVKGICFAVGPQTNLAIQYGGCFRHEWQWGDAGVSKIAEWVNPETGDVFDVCSAPDHKTEWQRLSSALTGPDFDARQHGIEEWMALKDKHLVSLDLPRPAFLDEGDKVRMPQPTPRPPAAERPAVRICAAVMRAG